MVLLIENQQMSKPRSFTCTVCLKKSPALEADWTAFLHEGEDLVCVCVVDDLPALPTLSEHQSGGGETQEIIKLLSEVEFVHSAVQTDPAQGELSWFDLTDGAGSIGADVVLDLVPSSGVGAVVAEVVGWESLRPVGKTLGNIKHYESF